MAVSMMYSYLLTVTEEVPVVLVLLPLTTSAMQRMQYARLTAGTLMAGALK